ncbi:MAG: hypothetical protein ACPF9D_11045 [Owenweeksia sp.]
MILRQSVLILGFISLMISCKKDDPSLSPAPVKTCRISEIKVITENNSSYDVSLSYDEKGRLIQYKELTGVSLDTYTYEYSGDVITITIYDANGDFFAKRINTLNDADLVTKASISWHHGDYAASKYYYTHDNYLLAIVGIDSLGNRVGDSTYFEVRDGNIYRSVSTSSGREIHFEYYDDLLWQEGEPDTHNQLISLGAFFRKNKNLLRRAQSHVPMGDTTFYFDHHYYYEFDNEGKIVRTFNDTASTQGHNYMWDCP